MANRIVLNTISYHGKGAIENIVPELTARGYTKAFVCSDPDLIKFGVTAKVTALLDAAILTAMNLADEHFKDLETAENLRRQLKDYLDESARLKLELSEAKREIFKLQNKK